MKSDELPVLPMEKLLLFDARTSFRALASDGALNHIISPCSVKPESGGLFVAGPAAASVSRLGMFWRFIKHCYFPI